MKEIEKRYKIAGWIFRKLTGLATLEEERELEAWRTASENNSYEYEDICRRLQMDLREKDHLDMAKEWQMFEKKLPHNRKIYMWRRYAVAACAMIGVVIGAVWMSRQENGMGMIQAVNGTKGYEAVLILSNGNRVLLGDSLQTTITEIMGTKIFAEGKQVRYDAGSEMMSGRTEWNTIEVPRGAEYELVLADGTKVWLNSESKLTYPVRFVGEKREVSMSGEMCFDVARNEEQPFIVKTEQVAVKVLGTLFNVESYPADHRVVTTLLRGKVEVASGESTRILNPDEQAIVREDGQIAVKEVYAEDYVSWTHGVFHFTETSLEEIMNRLARWYNIEFFFAAPSLKEAHFTLDIQRYEHVSAILSKIEMTGRVKFSVNGKTVVIGE